MLFLGILLLGLPVVAQTTEEPGDIGEVVEPVETGEPGVSFIERAVTFLTGAVAGGAGVLIAVFGTIGRFKNDQATLNMIEWLGKSIPPEALDKLNEIGRNMRDAGDVIDRVTDGEPNDLGNPTAGSPSLN